MPENRKKNNNKNMPIIMIILLRNVRLTVKCAFCHIGPIEAKEKM